MLMVWIGCEENGVAWQKLIFVPPRMPAYSHALRWLLMRTQWLIFMFPDFSSSTKTTSSNSDSKPSTVPSCFSILFIFYHLRHFQVASFCPVERGHRSFYLGFTPNDMKAIFACLDVLLTAVNCLARPRTLYFYEPICFKPPLEQLTLSPSFHLRRGQRPDRN